MHQTLSDRITELTTLLNQKVEELNQGTDTKIEALSQQNIKQFADSAFEVEEKCNDLERRS